jgi:ZIP family zinc transporter
MGTWIAVGSFFGGIIVAALIDKLIPEYENPHEAREIEEMDSQSFLKNKNLHRMGLFSAIVIAVHNFPEGLVTFASALSDPSLGIVIAVAVAIHNIPEGIAVAIPIYYATGNKKKAFFYSFLSGLAEPVGAVFAYLLLRQFFSDALFGILFAAVAGIMVFISLDELLPTAQKHGEHHLSIYGLVVGMAVMAISLLLLI